jgi:hypothetical protein
MQDYWRSPIFVFGLPRSGTSMVAGALDVCGAWTGTTVPGVEPENPKGFFEHGVIREQVTKQILLRLGCDPLGVRKLPPVGFRGEVPGLADFIRQIIEKDGYQHDRLWLYKDAKLSLLWPIFNKAFPDATWVLVRRDAEEVVQSCLRARFMKQHSDAPGFWRRYTEEYLRRIDALQQTDARILEVSSQDLVDGNLEGFKQVVSRLGLGYHEGELKQFVSPAYWHGERDS